MIAYFRQLPIHARTVALFLSGLVLVLALSWLKYTVGWFLEQNERISELEPRIARLQGLKLNEEALRQSAAAVQEGLSYLVSPAESDAAGVALQQETRRILEAAGLSVTGNQVVADIAGDSLRQLSINITATGGMDALDQALVELKNARPLLMIDSLNLSPLAMRRGEVDQNLNLALSISSVRLLQ
jgi:general secretion pathway protein M